MKINHISDFNLYFKGQRQDRKTVKQLSEDNDYDLNLINQRNISEAIENLAEIPGEDNVAFLIDTAENLKYTTNIDLGKKSYNDWIEKLKTSAEKSLGKSDRHTQEKLKPRIYNVFSTVKPLTNTENEILKLRKSLLETVDYKSLQEIKNSNIRNIKRNLDYFIISSEVPLTQKHYILKQLNYFMSPEYKINEQLEGKKSQALAEIVNDLVINTPESEIPNIKAVNQGQSGTCASISICRKLLAYEDKVNYVDIILSELDAKDYLEIYDITKLGTHTKIKVPKTYVDYTYALENGSRIIDAGAAYWMNVADMSGANNEQVISYNMYDKQNFDTFHDSHLTKDLPEEFICKQDYFKALIKAENYIKNYKKELELEKINKYEKYSQKKEMVQIIPKYKNVLANILKEYDKKYIDNPKLLHEDINSLIRQQKKIDETTSKYDYRLNSNVYISKDTEEFKLNQIKKLLITEHTTPEQKDFLNKNINKIQEIINEIRSLTDIKTISPEKRKYLRAKSLYQTAGAYRTQQVFALDIPDMRESMMVSLNIPDDETRLINNIDNLIKKLKNNTINSVIKNQLAINYQTENKNEQIISALEAARNNIIYLNESLINDFFNAILQKNKKQSLSNTIQRIKNIINDENDKETLLYYSSLLSVKGNKTDINKKLDKFQQILNSDKCSEDEFKSIFNQLGYKSIYKYFKGEYEQLAKILFEQQNEKAIKDFNIMNGLPENSEIEKTIEMYNDIGYNFNKNVMLINAYENTLNIVDENNNVLSPVSQKSVILKKLENMGEILTERELRILQTKLAKINNLTTEIDGRSDLFKKLPPELKHYTKEEQAILNKIEKNINGWSSNITRKLNFQYLDIKDRMEELNREIGIKTGNFWLMTEKSQGGLRWEQKIKIIEAMTDRPYHHESDGNKALEHIKSSPYSGISGVSMDINEPAYHAQYIADIAPVKIIENGKTVEKDTIFHDNTWGPVEHKRVWEDETGNLRTDYKRGYGLPSGFVTDNTYTNGMIADELFNTKGKAIHNYNQTKLLKKLDDEYYGSFPMFVSILTQGRYTGTDKIIHDIKLYMMKNPTESLEDLTNYAKKMSVEKIQKTIKAIHNSIDNIYIEYDIIEKKLKTEFFKNNKIISLEEYNKIPNNKLKLLLEKTALISSYPNIPDNKEFYGNLLSDNTEKLKKYIQDEAKNNFYFSFAKNIDILKFGAESCTNYLNKTLLKFGNDNKINITSSKITDIINDMKKISKQEFDGSLEHSIELLANKFKNSLTQKTPEFKNKQEKIQDLANNIKKVLKTNMEFTLADLNSPSSETDHFKNIVKWIDDKFNPATDEEFVQIYKRLQNMTTKEFDEKFGSGLTPEILEIKDINGYDILKQLNNENEKIQNNLYHTIFNMKIYSKLNMVSKTEPSYYYNKLERKYSGMYYKEKRTFEDLYYEYYCSLFNLKGTEKAFNKYRRQNFDKYRAFPAFPKIEIEEQQKLEEVLDELFENLTNNIEFYLATTTKIKSFKLIDNFKKYTNKLNSNQPLTTRQYNTIINNYLSEFLKLNDSDETIEKQIAQIKFVMENGKSADDFKELAEYLCKELNPYRLSANNESLESDLKNTAKLIKMAKKEFITSLIEPQYQKKAYEIINKWISATIKTADESKSDYYENKAEQYYEKLKNLFTKKIIYISPEKMLDNYLLMNAQNAKPENFNLQNKNQKEAQEDFEKMKATYKDSIESMLHIANILEMQYKIMSWSKKGHLNMIRQAMSNENMNLTNGDTAALDSDIFLNSLLSRMLEIDDPETALMFINQIGLGEQVINMVDKSKNITGARKNMLRIKTILDNAEKQVHIAGEELLALEPYENTPEFFDKLNEARENIIRKIKNTKYRKISSIYPEIINKTIEDLKNNPKLPEFATLKANMQIAKEGIIIVLHQDIEKLNNKLKQLQLIHDLIRQIDIPQESEANNIREKFLQEYQSLEVLNSDSLHKHYEELGLTI